MYQIPFKPNRQLQFKIVTKIEQAGEIKDCNILAVEDPDKAFTGGIRGNINWEGIFHHDVNGKYLIDTEYGVGCAEMIKHDLLLQLEMFQIPIDVYFTYKPISKIVRLVKVDCDDIDVAVLM